MQAVYCTQYGPPDVLELHEIAKPQPTRNQVCVKIHATSVTASDAIVRGFKMPRNSFMGFAMGLVLGFNKPRNPILGMILAGEIESVGDAVTRYKPGDRVFGYTVHGGMSMQFGAYAQYHCLHQNSLLVPVPDNLSWEEAAAIPYGGLMALSYLRKGNVQPGQQVLIYGASGSIGSMAVQIAKVMGAHVTGVCSTRNLEFVKSLGAAQVIDYTEQDFIDTDRKFDFILDAVGVSKSSPLKEQCVQALSPNGKYISVDDGSPSHTPEHMAYLAELAATGQIRPVIDKVYPLQQIVDAHRHVDTGHKRGDVVVSVAHGES